jgi:demethylmenaquinone methyltransferase / 2-methoxy-6-polyprenyl-1,4-benzoquinol methylase
MSFRLPATEEKADYVLDQFNRIARRYDLANDAISLGMHRLWKEAAIRTLDLKTDGHYLDVCCGTGDLTLRIADKLSAAGIVTGLDFSANMLELAKLRSEKKKHNAVQPAINFIEGDAQQLPFPDNHFDSAVISFGLRNLTHLDKGLSEMTRVVKPGGKVVNLDLGRPTNWLFTPIYYFYFRHIVPMIGKLLQNDMKAYTYLPQSLDTYPTPDRISELFKSVGLINVQYIPLAIGSVALHVGTKP